MPQLSININQILSRLESLADADVCVRCEDRIENAVADIAFLIIQIERLYSELCRARLRAANYEAAIRAALCAASDGEPDPLAYLRDELPEPQNPGYGRGWR
jgi:hypothetical protein